MAKKSLWKKFFGDIFTTANGDFDIARVIPYMIVGSAGVIFNFLELYAVMVKNMVFDPVAFGDGLLKVGAALLAAATGVWIKNPTEVPYNPALAGQGGPDAGSDAIAAAEEQVNNVGGLAQAEIAQTRGVMDQSVGFIKHVMSYFKK